MKNMQKRTASLWKMSPCSPPKALCFVCFVCCCAPCKDSVLHLYPAAEAETPVSCSTTSIPPHSLFQHHSVWCWEEGEWEALPCPQQFLSLQAPHGICQSPVCCPQGFMASGQRAGPRQSREQVGSAPAASTCVKTSSLGAVEPQHILPLRPESTPAPLSPAQPLWPPSPAYIPLATQKRSSRPKPRWAL